MNKMIDELYSIGLIPVIKIENADDAIPLAKALIDGGLPAAEITFRTSCAAEAIKKITDAYPEMLVGAGTVLTTEQVDAAIAAGSKFLVSPGLNPKVTAYCLSKGGPMLPGCSNPSDVEAALELGLSTVKFFPAEQSGGLELLRDLLGAEPEIGLLKLFDGVKHLCAYVFVFLALLALFVGSKTGDRLEFQSIKGGAGLAVSLFKGDEKSCKAIDVVLKASKIFFDQCHRVHFRTAIVIAADAICAVLKHDLRVRDGVDGGIFDRCALGTAEKVGFC